MKKLALFALAAGFALAAAAQEKQVEVGTLNDVSGAVTVSSQQAAKRVASGTRVVDGASILVASEGKATLVMDNGCRIDLKGGQFLKVDAKEECKALLALVKQLAPVAPVTGVAAAPAGVAGAGTTTVAGLGTANTAAVISAAVIGGVALLSSSGGSGSTPISPQ